MPSRLRLDITSHVTAGQPFRLAFRVVDKVSSDERLSMDYRHIGDTAKGAVRDVNALSLKDPRGRLAPRQTEVMNRWADGSVRVPLLDFIAKGVKNGGKFTLSWGKRTKRVAPPSPVVVKKKRKQKNEKEFPELTAFMRKTYGEVEAEQFYKFRIRHFGDQPYGNEGFWGNVVNCYWNTPTLLYYLKSTKDTKGHEGVETGLPG